jgi:hypothetical protein
MILWKELKCSSFLSNILDVVAHPPNTSTTDTFIPCYVVDKYMCMLCHRA